MNKRPVILRIFIALVVIAIFAVSIPPLTPLDFYQTFKSLVKNPNDPVVNKVITNAEELETNQQLLSSVALLEAANNDGVALKDYLKDPRDINDNRDVISKVRKNAASSIRLGIDLNGGVEFIIKLIIDKDEDGKVRKDADGNVITYDSEIFQRWRDLTIESLRKRLETQNIFESEISPIGQNMISLKAPIVSKDEKDQLRKIIQMSAKLRFRLVSEKNGELLSRYKSNPKNFTIPYDVEKMTTVDVSKGKKPVVNTFFVERHPLMTGKNIISAYPYRNDLTNQLEISLSFNAAGAQRFGEITKAYVNRQLGIVLDGQLYCAPTINTPIPDGRAVITGRFSNDEAKNISDALTSGSLPVGVKIEAIFDTDPTLGKANVVNGINAGLIALGLVMLFMMAYYLRAGVVAVVALGVNIVLVLGALAAFNATLTLPGIAGIVLTIGMAVDANVLIFERIREELEKGKSLINSIDIGYSKAFITIVDANLTTFFTAIILYRFGSGAIKGFAVTLSIGILTSMFTALFLTRLIFDLMHRWLPAQKMHMLHFLDHPKIDFLGKRKITAIISISLIVLSFAAVIYRGPTNILGVDFTGGTVVILDYSKRVPQEDVSKVLSDAGYNGRVTYKTSALSKEDTKKMEILLRESKTNKEGNKAVGTDIVKLLNSKYTDAKYKVSMETALGGLIGWEFSKSALIAMGLALLGIVIYISFRFEFAYAIASIIALMHDVIIATGILLLFDAEISLPVIAALLTIIGYSLNDTIVVFDRIREDLGLVKGKTYRQIINMSINQTLSRTILTSLTTLIVLLVLFFFGGIAVNDFVFVMLIGVIVGTYSSIFVASPIVAVWHKRVGREISDENEIVEAEIVDEE